MIRDAFIIDAVRTPIGRYGGALARVRPDDLAAVPLSALVARAGIDPATVEDVVLGCANQAGEDNRNVARMAALLAHFPVEVAGQTVNRLCGSGLQAVNSAAHAIAAGEAGVLVAGGVESMTRAPFVMLKPEEGFARGAPQVADTVLGWRFTNPRFADEWTVTLGVTAENVAEKHGITRADQDAFALESQKRAQAAINRFADEIIAVDVPGHKGTASQFCKDEHPRPETTLEQLAQLRPAFKASGTVTAGNSSGLNDGAAALLLMSQAALADKKPIARIVATAVAGVEPHLMGMGPVPATRIALRKAGLKIQDMALFEINEAFASQSVACIRQLDIDPSIVNVNGGAIALGHPLGASGARILTTLIHELRKRGGGKGVATMCIGVGQGIATVVEVFA